MRIACLQRPGPERGLADGFLLTETLATFTISAFVLLGLVSASSALLHAVDRSIAQVQDVDDLDRTISAIARDVSSLARVRWNGIEPQPFVFRGGTNSLFFARPEREPDGSSDMRVIALRNVVSGRGTWLMRGEARLSARAAGFGDLEYGPQRSLGTGSARLRFAYMTPGGKNSKSARRREWPVGQILPAAIIVEAIERETGRLLVSVPVPIHANADIGCMKNDPARSQAAAPPIASASSVDVPPPPTAQANVPAAEASPDTSSTAFCGRQDSEKDEPPTSAESMKAPKTGLGSAL